MSSKFNTVLWRTRECKEQAQPEVPVKKIEPLEWASMHVFSSACIPTWKESGCVSLMTQFDFGRCRLLKYGVAYSCNCSHVPLVTQLGKLCGMFAMRGLFHLMGLSRCKKKKWQKRINCQGYSPFQKNWALTTTTCRLIRTQTVARP